jgi:hypothetical protein
MSSGIFFKFHGMSKCKVFFILWIDLHETNNGIKPIQKYSTGTDGVEFLVQVRVAFGPRVQGFEHNLT